MSITPSDVCSLARPTRDLSDSQSGGFYSAEDADSLPTHDAQQKREGAFCVWTHDEIHNALTHVIKKADEREMDEVSSGSGHVFGKLPRHQ